MDKRTDLDKVNLLMTGVGGQGVILASDIVGEVAIAAAYDFKKTDTLGMAQRGGSVISHIRIAPKVWSPLIAEGGVDILLSLEKLEAARWAHCLKPGGVAIVNDHAVPPISVNLGNDVYPDDDAIIAAVKKTTAKLYFIAGFKKAQEMGNVKALNMLMLGCVSRFLPMDTKLWKDCIAYRLPAAVLEINNRAFDAGRGEIADVNLR
ncbi:indolepyruvate oxidoreductase subunit beta [Chloroflexota bacterium]